MKEYIIVINTILQKLHNNDVPQLTYSLHSPQKHPALSQLFNILKVTTWNPVELPTNLARCLRVRTWNSVELPTYLARCLRVSTWNFTELSTYLARCLRVRTWNWVELSTYLVRCPKVTTWNSVELWTCLARCLKVTTWNPVKLSTCLCLARQWGPLLVPQKATQFSFYVYETQIHGSVPVIPVFNLRKLVALLPRSISTTMESSGHRTTRCCKMKTTVINVSSASHWLVT